MGVFSEKLLHASQMNNSSLCVGLDPEPSFHAGQVVELNRIIIQATAKTACAYKPNLAIYEAMGKEGLEALEQTLELVRSVNPDIPIIGDAKRGDIGEVSVAYAHTMLDQYKFDAVTVNPYMGHDSLEAFLTRDDKGIFILCRTSNPGGGDLQDLKVVGNGSAEPRALYEVVAELAKKWDRHDNVGLVVGATHPDQIRRVRQICPNNILLIPGVGPQGGDLKKAVSSAINDSGGGFIINASRQIMRAVKTPKGALRTKGQATKFVREVSRRLRDEINGQVRIALERKLAGKPA